MYPENLKQNSEKLAYTGELHQFPGLLTSPVTQYGDVLICYEGA